MTRKPVALHLIFNPLSIGLASLFLIMAVASPALAQENIATGLLGKFTSQTDGWWGILRGYALFLFTTTLIVEICLFGVRIALQGSNIAEAFGQFVTLMLFACFIAAVIMNYQEWTTGIAIKGLRPLTGELTGNSVDAGMPLAMAAAVVDKILPVMGNAGITDFGEVYLYVTCMLIILVVFVLISALVILVTCEFYIIANIGILLIGLGGSKIFKDHAINVMRYILAVAFKLFVLQLIVNIGFAIISLTDLDASVGSTVKSIKFVDLFYLIGKSVILLALAKSLPDTCAGIINGSAIGGGNPLASMARTAGAMAGATAVGAISGGAGYMAGAARSLKAAHTLAKEDEEVSGFRQTAARMRQGISEAREDAKAAKEQKNLESHPESVHNQLVSQINSARAERLLDNQGDNAGEAETSGQAGSALPSGQLSSTASSAASAAGAGNTAPANAAAQPTPNTAGGSGQPAPAADNTSSGEAPASDAPNAAGGSGQPAPQPASGAAESGVSGSSSSESGSGRSAPPRREPPQAPATGGGTADMTGYNPSGSNPAPRSGGGTVDMTSFDPSSMNR